MANPTSNFGWQMPTPTDLVTDLPADFEVFGQAVDTSMADLKGGTTDQVLAKNSNTDMDFKWVTSDDANAIQNAQLTAKGALITAFSAGSPATLTVGNNGETLVADSSTSTGLDWKTATEQYPWQTWTPTYTNFTLGNGSVVARYQQIGKLVNVYVSITWGSTTSTGSGPEISYPVAPKNKGSMNGLVYFNDNGVGVYLGRVFMGTNGLQMTCEFTGSTFNAIATVTASNPTAFGNTDAWNFTATYEAD